MMYVSKKNEEVRAKVIQEEEKYGTVLLEYVSGEKVGKNFSITTSTLKRWWRKADETVEVVSPEKDPTDESLALLGGGDSAEIVEKEDKKVRVIDEIQFSNGQVLRVDVTDADKEIEKAAEKEKSKPIAKVPSGDVAKVKTLLEDKFILISHPSTPGEYAVKKEADGKNVAVIRIGKKALTVYVNRTNIKFDYSISLENAVEQFCNYVETK